LHYVIFSSVVFFIVHFVCFFVASAFPSSLNFERGLAV